MPATYATYHSKDVARHPVSLVGRGAPDIARVLFAAIAMLCPGCRRDPPDLTACTRVEVHYGCGALDYFFPGTVMQPNILSEVEREYVRTFDSCAVTDQGQIRAFADRIRRGRHRGRVFSRILDIPVSITCYQGRKRVASFSIYPSMPTVIADGHGFAYPPGSPILRDLDPPALEPLTARWECAMKLSGLLFGGLWQGRERPPCPDPDQWCDVIVRTMRKMHITNYELDGKRRRQYPDRVIATWFTCPAVHAPTDGNGVYSPPDQTDPLSPPAAGWVSDYAMNSNCREGSPDDMVFLFESQPGWNQHGGPNLFTFDNHDPRGGCVLLNDGSVKFIRTKEELEQLRWK